MLRLCMQGGILGLDRRETPIFIAMLGLLILPFLPANWLKSKSMALFIVLKMLVWEIKCAI
jgi:ABC-type sugar transport system permease subunit